MPRGDRPAARTAPDEAADESKGEEDDESKGEDQDENEDRDEGQPPRTEASAENPSRNPRAAPPPGRESHDLEFPRWSSRDSPPLVPHIYMVILKERRLTHGHDTDGARHKVLPGRLKGFQGF